MELSRDLRLCREKSQICRPSSLPPAVRPSAQNGLRSDLEMANAVVTTKPVWENLVALKKRLGHKVNADCRAPPNRVACGWWPTFLRPQRRRCLGTCMDHGKSAPQHIRTTFPPSHTHHQYVRSAAWLWLLLNSLHRRARAAGLLLRQPTSQSEQAMLGTATAGHEGGQEAPCRGRTCEATHGARGGL